MKGRHLVTGGAGMIGSHLSKKLLKMGCEVVSVDNLMSGCMKNIKDLHEYDNFSFVKGDMRDSQFADYICKGVDYVWALAANMGGILRITSTGADIMHDNVIINANTLEAAYKSRVPNYFYSSSACAYPGYKQERPDVPALKESDAFPADPDQFYGWEKLFSEKMAEAYGRDYLMNIHIARFHNVYGEAYTAFDLQKAKAPCKMILKALQKQSIEIWNDGLQTRSFLYIDDCIDGIIKLMKSDYHEAVNIGSDYEVSMRELAALVIEISGVNKQPIYLPDKPQGVRGRNADLTLVKEVLGWQPKVSLRDGMARVYKWGAKNFDELVNIGQHAKVAA